MGGDAIDPIWIDVLGGILCALCVVSCVAVAIRIVLGFLGIA